MARMLSVKMFGGAASLAGSRTARGDVVVSGKRLLDNLSANSPGCSEDR
jgi:hypothetical protein